MAEPDDLFRVLDEQQKADGILPPDMNVKTIMDSWTLQPGFPVIHVRRENGGIQLSQVNFLNSRIGIWFGFKCGKLLYNIYIIRYIKMNLRFPLSH